MKNQEINIRDPFVLCEDGRFYLYGTRAAHFGRNTGGFDVYVSEDLETWSDPIPCFDSAAFGLNREVNWAPEVHRYQDMYYMFATFTGENGRRGTYALRADNPRGPFVPHSDGPLTPLDWESLDGTLYLAPDGQPYLVFCHEHTQLIDGTICYVPLTPDLTRPAADPVTLFSASSTGLSDPLENGHYVTDGPFLHTADDGQLYMIWSTFIAGQYAECLVRFDDGRLNGRFTHLPPLLTSDGGHGMLFHKDGQLLFTYHTPNTTGLEHPAFRVLDRLG